MGGILGHFGGYGASFMGILYYNIWGGRGVFVRRPWTSSHAEVPALTYYLGGESASTLTKVLTICKFYKVIDENTTTL